MHSTTVKVIDSHTGGEPTRIIVEGGPDLGTGPLARRLQRFRETADDLRAGVVLEPRGSDVVVGGLLCAPSSADCAAGVIFFNNTGYLNMCGHGTIGLMVTLRHLKRIEPGAHRIETPVGTVTATLHDDHRVSVTNVPSWRYRTGVTVNVPDHGPVTGDIAWGGNWFFLISDHGQTLTPDRTADLTRFAGRIRAELDRQQITGANGGVIDHIELFSSSVTADSRNFVLCPGGAYDRSPCGTGTSAKLACLAADGKLNAGDRWRQESIVGSVFEASFQPTDDAAGPSEAEGPVVLPTITGTAWVTAVSELHFDSTDPFRTGIQV